MHNPKHISRNIHQFILPSGLSIAHQELLRLRLINYRRGLSEVLASLEHEFGQSLGVVSHLFAVWKVVAGRNESFSFFVLLTCCWWISAGKQTMIKRNELVKLTGLSVSQCSKHLHAALIAGYLAHYRSRRHYYLTAAGSRYIEKFFEECFSMVLAMYDESQ